MLFIGDAGGEIDAATERKQVPEAVELERRAVGGDQRIQKGAGHRIVVIDFPIAEIADPKLAVHEGKSPGRVEIPVRNDPSQEIAARVEDINETVPRPGD